MPVIQIMQGAHAIIYAVLLGTYLLLATLILVVFIFMHPEPLDLFIGICMLTVSAVGLLLAGIIGKRTPVMTHVMLCGIQLGFTTIWIVVSTGNPEFYTTEAKVMHGVAFAGVAFVMAVLCVLMARARGLETIAAPLLIPSRQECKLLPVVFSTSAIALCVLCLILTVTTSKVVKTYAMLNGGFYEGTISCYLSEGFAIAIPIMIVVSVLMSAAVISRHPFKRQCGSFNATNIVMVITGIVANTALIGLTVFTNGSGHTGYPLQNLDVHMACTRVFFLLITMYELFTATLVVHNIIAGTVRASLMYCSLVVVNGLASLSTALFYGYWAANNLSSKNYFEWMSVSSIWVNFVILSVLAFCTEPLLDDGSIDYAEVLGGEYEMRG